MVDYETRLLRLIYKDAPDSPLNHDPKKNSVLEIRYVLNRIAANDPRDTAFELERADTIANADRLALQIAKAFQTNTACQTVVLNHIGLTDKGMMPILSVLQHKELKLLDVGENKLSDESFRAIEAILSNQENKWLHVKLGRVRDPNWRDVFARHPNVSFSFEDHTIHGASGVLRHFFGRTHQK